MSFKSFMLFLAWAGILTSYHCGFSVQGQKQSSQSSQSVDFTCPEEFGYFPHPSDCAQYYVCVFGGALLESCTGGLMYSNELQTCDWPRNVGHQSGCQSGGSNASYPQQSLVEAAPQQQVRSQQPPSRVRSTTVPSQQQQQYAYKPIRIDTYGDLREAINNQQQPSGVQNNQEEEYLQSGRAGRSYAQDIPDYKNSYGKTQEVPQGRSVSGHHQSKYQGTRYEQPQSPQYEDPYSNQRYASSPQLANTSSYFYQQSPSVAPTAASSSAGEDDSSYYVYDDEEEAVDYKYQQQPAVQPVTYRTTTTTTTTTTTPRPQRTRSKSSSSSSSSSGRRPTLKPKSSIVPKESAPVRDVYLDPPSRPLPFYSTPKPNTPSTKCRKDVCLLPDCYCGGKDIPGGLRPEQTPQIVLLTFDDSVNDLNKNLYRDLFEKGRKNPNGCPISATFYVSHEWTDYSQVQNLAADGHEIASHSVSHSFGEAFGQKKWEKEINGQREILAAYGGVKLSDIRGMRAPFLAIGGNNMFKMLHDANFTYDSSMPVYENRPPSWPYTLDYKIFHDCMIPPCPTKSYPGVWEVPMVMWQDLKGGRCSMGDACSNPPTAEGVYQMLAKNFERHYTTNRAPFGLYYHAAWFTQAHHKEGFEAFLDTLVQMDDVWLVTNYQAIEWVRNPTPSSKINSFKPWNTCHDPSGGGRPQRCTHPRVCNLWHKSGVRYMKTCQVCPQQYPWTGNTGVPYTI